MKNLKLKKTLSVKFMTHDNKNEMKIMQNFLATINKAKNFNNLEK